MNAPTPQPTPADPLAKLREPFPAHQISKLPKETKTQIDERKADRTKGVSCKVCGSWHHKNAVHLDYVGHAALTDRLLDTDPFWSWEPLAFRDGLPAFDPTGGLWIKLTVCGVTRLGYGHAALKPHMDPGAREKEVIGDALRNAAMRFGAALDLWHKGDLHADEDEGAGKPRSDISPGGVGPDFEGAEGSRGRSSYAAKKDGGAERFNALRKEIEGLESMVAVGSWQTSRLDEIKTFPEAWRKQLREDLEEQKRVIRSLTEGAEGDDSFPGGTAGDLSRRGHDRAAA